MCLKNLRFLLKNFQVVLSLKKWTSMAYTVCNAPRSMTSYMCYHNTYDVILMSKARFHVTVRTQINKFVVYFIVGRNVNFGCSEC